MSARSDLSEIALDRNFADRRNTADYVADALRSAINAGVLADGAVLNQAELATHFGVSRVPVREALRQLQAEGLIELRVHHLAVVRGLTIERLQEVYTLRAVLESWLIETATKNLTVDDIAHARQLNDRLLGEEDHGKWLALNAEFHATLYTPAKASMTMEILEQLRARGERYARMWSKGTGIHRPEEAATEHGQILALVERGDAKGAAAAVYQHVIHTRDRVVDHGANAGHEISETV